MAFFQLYLHRALKVNVWSWKAQQQHWRNNTKKSSNYVKKNKNRRFCLSFHTIESRSTAIFVCIFLLNQWIWILKIQVISFRFATSFLNHTKKKSQVFFLHSTSFYARLHTWNYCLHSMNGLCYTFAQFHFALIFRNDISIE